MGLSAYSNIQLPDLTAIRAENVMPGNTLREAMTGVAATVEKVHNGPAVGMYRIAGENGAIVDLTEDHQVLTRAGMTAAGQIRVGDELLTAAGPVRCSESQPLFGDFMVYDIVVRPDGPAAPCLTANGLVVAAMRAH